MGRRVSLALAGCLLVLGACGGDDPIPSPTLAPEAGATTTSSLAATTVPETTTPPESSSSTTAPPAASTTTTAPDTTTTSTTQPEPELVPLDQLDLALTLVADGFDQPVFVTAPPGDPRLFVVDQPGIIWVIDQGEPEVFLDIRDEVVFRGERGLLGLAFAPDFAETGLFYVDYTAEGRTVIAEYVAEGATASQDSARIVLEVDQPASNHNGGMLAFGPEGALWIAMGDGGGSDDRYGNAQDPSTLLGTLLRIDPTTDPATAHPDNPGGEWREEIWAIGLRNPWRFAFDGDVLWIADVGQTNIEEVDRVEVSAVRNANFGWPWFEGTDCYLTNDCDTAGLTAPVYEYTHAEGCSITGGFAYRGAVLPELAGHYFFADHCTGWIRSLTPDGATAIEWLGPGSIARPTSFGLDALGELYVTSIEGAVYRLTRG